MLLLRLLSLLFPPSLVKAQCTIVPQTFVSFHTRSKANPQYIGNAPQTVESNVVLFNAMEFTATWSLTSCPAISVTYSWMAHVDGTRFGPITWSAGMGNGEYIWVADFAVITVSRESSWHTAFLVYTVAKYPDGSRNTL